MTQEGILCEVHNTPVIFSHIEVIDKCEIVFYKCQQCIIESRQYLNEVGK